MVYSNILISAVYWNYNMAMN